MAKKKFDIYVYAHWQGIDVPLEMGILSAHFGKGKKAFSFQYNKDWIKSKHQILIDPDIQFFSGPQYPNNKENFGVFLDSMPDTWGKTLMKRRAAHEALAKGEKAPNLYEIDYLLGVYDKTRMGALRFKTDPNGPFLDHNDNNPTPPWTSAGELQEAVTQFENDNDNKTVKKWLNVLIAPGSSLGGARPKANILDNENNLWIAKFPSKSDTTDKAAWELLAYQLAIAAGIKMAPSKIEKISGKYHTFFTKRFDREKEERIHFASAMTLLGKSEESIRDNQGSYLEIAEFIQTYGTNIEENLQQLWKRIVFNIAISNTDDHLRNHGFLLTNAGWVLSPAYDINPSVEKDGLALNIDMENNALNINLAKSVGTYFRLNESQMEQIIQEVAKAVITWKLTASKLGIPKKEQEMMAAAFRL
ncbi:MAG: HipA domain-containing protein [Gelidibacter sp.]|nr:HipA domain-containing protein [Gelidibacter sp.]